MTEKIFAALVLFAGLAMAAVPIYFWARRRCRVYRIGRSYVFFFPNSVWRAGWW